VRISRDSLRVVGRGLRAQCWVVAVCVVVAPVVAFVVARAMPRRYSATATVLLVDPSVAEQLAGVQSAAGSADPSLRLSTELGLASLDVVGDRTARSLGPRYARSGVPGSVLVNNDGVSNLLTVTATEPRPALAARVANAYARQYIAFRTAEGAAQVGQQRADARALLRKIVAPGGSRSAEAAGLRGRIVQLTTLASLQNTNWRLAESAIAPSSPSSPATRPIVLKGLGLGLLLGVLLALLFGTLDRRLRDPREVGALLDSTVVGAIPSTRRALSGRGESTRRRAQRESFAAVVASLRHFGKQPVRSVLVTSTGSGDRRSMVSWNLAVAAARAGIRVLLVEADLRRPSLAAWIWGQPQAGLADVLAGELSLNDAVRPVPSVGQEGAFDPSTSDGSPVDRARTATAGLRGEDQGELVALCAGGPTEGGGSRASQPGAMLASHRMGELIRRAEGDYDLVLIDTPPTSVISDAVPLVKSVSGVLIVTRMRQDTREHLRQLRDHLHNLRARTLGVVVTDKDRTIRARPTPTAVALCAGLAAAVLGFTVSRTTTGSSSLAPLNVPASAGSLRVLIPSGWRQQAVPPTAPLGLTDQLILVPGASSGGTLMIGRTHTSDATVLPPSLLAIAGRPKPQIVVLDGREFYRYGGLSPGGFDPAGSVYALPTTIGTVLGVCLPTTAPVNFTIGCERVIGTIRLASGTVLPLGPSRTYAASLTQVIERLNAVRTSAGSQLRTARDAQHQGQAATALAVAHARAASALSRLSAGQANTANSAIVSALRMTADAYRALATAAAGSDARAYRTATTMLARATNALDAAFAQLEKLGYRVG
jgi:polysaccharide biosynthesis transport protein